MARLKLKTLSHLRQVAQVKLFSSFIFIWIACNLTCTCSVLPDLDQSLHGSWASLYLNLSFLAFSTHTPEAVVLWVSTLFPQIRKSVSLLQVFGSSHHVAPPQGNAKRTASSAMALVISLEF